MLLAKLLFAAAAIYWMSHKTDFWKVWAGIRNAHPLPVVLGILLGTISVAIAGWRWHRWLAILDIEIPLISLICIAQIGQFFLMFLPGPMGDDLTRMLYISRLTKDRTPEACTTVVLDRFVGLASVLLLALLCIPGQWSLLAARRQTHWLAMAMVAAGALILTMGLAFFLTDSRRTRGMLDAWLQRLPASMLTAHLREMTGRFCASKAAIAQIAGAAFGTQFLSCVLYYLAGTATGVEAPLSVWLSFVPVVLMASALPISVAGFGFREYLLILFLGVFAHVDKERALAASFVAFSMILAVCLLGGVMYVFYKPSRSETSL